LKVQKVRPMPTCPECRRGFHDTCFGDCNCDHLPVNATDASETPSSEVTSESDADEIVSAIKRQRRNKPDHAVKDQQSTGRKRAAKLYPLDPTKPCEWRNTYGQGGGDVKIYGCKDGFHQARHHGPDKNTLNNEPGNVHRICHVCHNKWHAKNDPNYDPNKPLKD